MAIRAYDGNVPRPPRTVTPRPQKSPKALRRVTRPNLRALVPAAARRPERALTEVEEDLSAEAVETFTKALGGRDALIHALAVADVGGQSDRVVNILLDPRYAHDSIRQICAYAGITIADLFASYKKAALTKAHIEATHLIASKLVPVVDDVMTRAAPEEIVCPDCHGTPPLATPGQPLGQPPPACATCAGSGWVVTEPDLDRQKLALELGHLTEKKAGLIVQQNQGVITAASLAIQGGGALEQLHQAVSERLFSPTRRRKNAPPPVIDDPRAEPAPRDEPPEEEDPDQLDPEQIDSEDEDDATPPVILD